MIDRESKQLLLTAKHYISQAKRLLKKDTSLLKKTIKQITVAHDPVKLLREELILAHLGSSSVRLCTICEKHKMLLPPYRNQFYERGRRKDGMSKDFIIKALSENLKDHILFLLRDNIGHNENIKINMAEDRFDVLQSLSVKNVIENIELAFNEIHKRIYIYGPWNPSCI